MNQSLTISMQLTSLFEHQLFEHQSTKIFVCVCVVDEDGAGENEG